MRSMPVGDGGWFAVIDMLRMLLETGNKGTVFAGPDGTVTPLPLPLGGDKTVWPELAAFAAKYKGSFFELVQQKAHYLMLPKSIITTLNDSGKVLVSEIIPNVPKAQGQTIQRDDGKQEIRIPGASAGLAQAGYALGRLVGPPEPYYEILATIYHEMTHAWINLAALRQIDDAELRNLIVDGVNAYAGAVDLADNPINAALAFSEATAAYVDDKIGRWCSALSELDILLRLKMPAGDLRDARLQQIVDDYGGGGPVYGVIGPTGMFIKSPELSAELRDVINTKILDGLSLTKPFDATPLAGLRTAVSSAP
jgi:hypothetical protein